jgi:8-oxo-dGTP pyrophosphatase MutT (NUDIX family)
VLKEKVLLEATLCFLRRGNMLLLARKTRHIGAGCFNGYGGGLEGREDPKKAMIRELFEEAGILASSDDLEKVAEVHFYNTKSDGTVFVCKCHVYHLWTWKGEPKATNEMAEPTWFTLDKLPFDEMMPADSIWLPQTFNNKKIVATIHYGPFQKELIGPVLMKEVDHL